MNAKEARALGRAAARITRALLHAETAMLSRVACDAHCAARFGDVVELRKALERVRDCLAAIDALSKRGAF